MKKIFGLEELEYGPVIFENYGCANTCWENRNGQIVWRVHNDSQTFDLDELPYKKGELFQKD